jgi:hypothetical protein
MSCFSFLAKASFNGFTVIQVKLTDGLEFDCPFLIFNKAILVLHGTTFSMVENMVGIKFCCQRK